jgi:hypothetical protein
VEDLEGLRLVLRRDADPVVGHRIDGLARLHPPADLDPKRPGRFAVLDRVVEKVREGLARLRPVADAGGQRASTRTSAFASSIWNRMAAMISEIISFMSRGWIAKAMRPRRE